MRRARFTYPGSFHHAMNRGHHGEAIFAENSDKKKFLELLKLYSYKLRIRIFAYCIMSNHYHLVLENSSGKMSEFFKYLNGQFGMYFRKNYGESGYVFQGRYKSTLIQNDVYLKVAIQYLLQNPVRAGIVKEFDDYEWSSGKDYFSGRTSEYIEAGFVEELFVEKEKFDQFVKAELLKKMPIIKNRQGDLLGTKDFLETAIISSERRKTYLSEEMKRIDDNLFEPVKKVIQEFEKKAGQKAGELDEKTHTGKRVRGELLRRLKDLSGLTYSEINKIPPFCGLKTASLPKLYKDACKRLQITRDGEK